VTPGTMLMILSERIRRGEVAVAKARAVGRWNLAEWERRLEDLKRCQPRFEAYQSDGRTHYNLIIPFSAPKKYHWWDGGQSVLDTATELVLSEMINRKVRQ
jgi:hypothetical protein